MSAVSTVRDDASYLDAEGVQIHYYRWSAAEPGTGADAAPDSGPTPAAAPRGIVQIAHGIGEHALRYAHVAEALVAAGFLVYADDHRGHGRTGIGQWGEGEKGQGALGPGGLRATIAAVHRLSELIREEHPETPVFLLGHSWGSLMTQIILNRHSEDYAGVVLSGSAYRMPGSMNSGGFNRAFAHLGDTGYEWLSRDAAVAEAFRDDPLAFSADVMDKFGLADTLRLVGRPARNLPHRLPVLLQVGSTDPVGGGASVTRLGEALRRRSGLTDVEVVIYPDARHEIYNETNREEAIGDLVAWLTARS